MAMEAARAIGVQAADPLDQMVARDGSASHGWCHTLTRTVQPRDLCDAVHQLLVLHGRHPGIFDHAAARATSATMQDWLAEAAAAFAVQRGYLNQLVVAAGPLPSTPGQAESEAAVIAQCHAVEMLARSDRAGCAAGAAMALALDWPAVRGVLDVAADRFGVAPAPPMLALPASVHGGSDAMVPPPAQRGAGFGARQMLLQHRGLWDLLEARAAARRPA